MTKHILRALALGALCLGLAVPAGAATITILNNDGVGEGFNDATPKAPVGGNPGVTLGAQRLFVFQHAAAIWGSILPSDVTIIVRAQFNPQTCTSTSAVLGSAGPVTTHRDFMNAPFASTWYHAALANKLAGSDLSATNPDINATFNSQIDAGCFGTPPSVWYYGIDGAEGTNIELLPVILHEMGHGLGFSTTTSGSTGNYSSGSPSIYDRFAMDNTLGLHWNQMTALQRQANAISVTHLVWDGSEAIAQAATTLGPRPQMTVNAPAGIVGDYAAQTATFGASLTVGGFTGDVVLADDGGGDNPNDACEALVNGAALSGKIALVDRGTCTFVLKAQAVQAAGAVGLIVANNVSSGLPPMGGTDPSITIPCIGISLADGNTLKANLAMGVNVTLRLNPAFKAGADDTGKPLLYAPNPFASGSSVSHWDVTHSPNSLMEPAINNDLHDSVDLTLGHFKDIGWFIGQVATTLEEFSAEGRDDGILVRWRFADPSDVIAMGLQRAESAEGPWSPIRTEVSMDGPTVTALDTGTEVDRTYFYRVHVTFQDGESQALGLASAKREAQIARFGLDVPRPNPSLGESTVKFRLPAAASAQLVVCDVSGRKIRTLHTGTLAAGEHVRTWDGRTDLGSEAPAGVYFVSLHSTAGTKTHRVTLVR